MMIHLQNTSLACRAVVRSIGFLSLAFLAEAGGARGFDGECREILLRRRFMGGKMGVASLAAGVQRRTWICEDGNTV